MSNILVAVDGQALTVMDAPKIAAQGIKEDYIVFTFDESWNGFGKTAVFYKEDNESAVYTSAVDGTGAALVPHEVTDVPGRICFGVYGVKNDIVFTSEILKYKIVNGKYTVGQSSETPTPGMYEQMLTLAGQMTTQFETIYEHVNNLDRTVEAQVSTIIANYNVHTIETTLYSNGTGAEGTGTEITLSESSENFDYIDIYVYSAGEGVINTITAEQNSVHVLRVINLSDYTGGSGIPALSAGEMKVKLVGTKLTITNHSYFRWSTLPGDPIAGNVNSSYDGSMNGQEGKITKVVGRKIISNAELEDARIGVDGTVYNSAGDAIREQIGAISSNVAVSVDVSGIMHFEYIDPEEEEEEET